MLLLLLAWPVDAVQRALREGLHVPGAVKLLHKAVVARVGEADGTRVVILPHKQLCRQQQKQKADLKCLWTGVDGHVREVDGARVVILPHN